MISGAHVILFSADAAADNVVQAEDQQPDDQFNVPTNGPPSPLYGAKPFSQKMLRFEEFGTRRLNLEASAPQHNWKPFPAPAEPFPPPIPLKT